VVQSQLGRQLENPYLEKTHHKKIGVLVKQLKVWALSLSPVPPKKI
jgi:hypothetical protein